LFSRAVDHARLQCRVDLGVGNRLALAPIYSGTQVGLLDADLQALDVGDRLTGFLTV
jgi:hypothetical protein